MSRYLRSTLIAAASAVTMFSAQAAQEGAAGASGTSAGKRPLQVIGLTSDQRLIAFQEHQPESARDLGPIRGLMAGDAVVGIDFRVQDGQLYAVTRSGGIYIVNQATAEAARVSQLSVALEGNAFGVDFNPAADRLRIVSDSGQNLRHNVNSGGTTLVDDPLDYPPATPLNAAGPNAGGVTASAYTNNDLDPATGTTLYAIDTGLDQLVLQSPPNDGTLAASGKLGKDAGPQVGFDIYSTVRDGATVGVEALASVAPDGGPAMLYRVNLVTGRLHPVGSFASQNRVTGIAIPLAQR